MRGFIKAVIRFHGVCHCSTCARVQMSSQTNSLELDMSDTEDISSVMERGIGQLLVQPPVGWAMSGRNIYKCDACLAASYAPAPPARVLP